MNKDAKWLAWLEQQFSRISGDSRQISLHDFTEVLGVKEVIYYLLSHAIKAVMSTLFGKNARLLILFWFLRGSSFKPRRQYFATTAIVLTEMIGRPNRTAHVCKPRVCAT